MPTIDNQHDKNTRVTADVLPHEQAAFEAFGAAWERLRSVEEAVRAGHGPSSTHASAIQEMQVQARELKVALSAPALARAEEAEAEVKRLREALDTLLTGFEQQGATPPSAVTAEVVGYETGYGAAMRNAARQVRAALAGSPS